MSYHLSFQPTYLNQNWHGCVLTHRSQYGTKKVEPSLITASVEASFMINQDLLVWTKGRLEFEIYSLCIRDWYLRLAKGENALPKRLRERFIWFVNSQRFYSTILKPKYLSLKCTINGFQIPLVHARPIFIQPEFPRRWPLLSPLGDWGQLSMVTGWHAHIHANLGLITWWNPTMYFRK